MFPYVITLWTNFCRWPSNPLSFIDGVADTHYWCWHPVIIVCILTHRQRRTRGEEGWLWKTRSWREFFVSLWRTSNSSTVHLQKQSLCTLFVYHQCLFICLPSVFLFICLPSVFVCIVCLLWLRVVCLCIIIEICKLHVLFRFCIILWCLCVC